MEKRVYKNVELKKDIAGRFKEYCRDMHLKFEPSEAGEYIHFEVFVNKDELRNANEFLSNLDDDEYTPSATNGDYSPSNPWDAPGMSIRDFI